MLAPPNRVGAITNGERAISADTALRLGRYFGTGATFSMNLQDATTSPSPSAT